MPEQQRVTPCEVKGTQKELFVITIPCVDLFGVFGVILWRLADNVECSEVRDHDAYKGQKAL